MGDQKGKVGRARQRITIELLADKRAKPPAAREFLWDDEVPGFVVRVTPRGEIAYYIAVDRRRRHALKLGPNVTLAQAREAAKTKLARITTGEIDAAPRRDIPKLADYRSTRYDDEFRAAHRTGRGLAHLEPLMPKFGTMRLDEITHDHVVRWRTTRVRDGAKPATVNRNVGALKALLNDAVRKKVIRYSPLAATQSLSVDDDKRVRFLEGDEGARLRKALKAREERMRAERDTANQWRAERGYQLLPDLRALPYVDHLMPMVLLTLNTGARLGEMLKLEWPDARPTAITIRSATAKSRRTRHIPLNAEGRDVLAQWRQQCRLPTSGYVFAGRDGKQRDNVKKAWHGVLAEAGIANFRWHDLRHDFASRLVQNGVPLNTVRELLGHSDLKLTQRYAHLDEAHLRAAVEVL